MLLSYETESGQKVNLKKSTVFFSTNVIAENRINLCLKLQMGKANKQSRYLGLRKMLGWNKSAILGFLKDKVKTRIGSWGGKKFSQGGKEILVKSVAQSLPIFLMSVFLLPLEVTRDIERSVANFWWTLASRNGRGIHWQSWERLSKHKVTGGLGFRNFRDFNLDMLGKQAWTFITRPDSLASKIYKARYFAQHGFLEAKLGGNPIFIWRSIWEAKEVVISGLRWCIG